MQTLRVALLGTWLMIGLAGCYASASNPPPGGVSTGEINRLTEKIDVLTTKLDRLTDQLTALTHQLSQGGAPGTPLPLPESGPRPQDESAVLSAARAAAEEYDRLCAKYPDVPRVELMTEVEGIRIPRNLTKGIEFRIGGPLPVDVGNTYAAGRPAEPTTGGRLSIRLNAEPKTMNPITETSAYQSIIQEYTHDALAWRNPETLEYEPKLASKWVTEDVVKLSADYPGHVRRIRQGEGEPAASLEIAVPAVDQPADAPQFTFQTLNEAGEPLGHVWVGLYPLDVEHMPGAKAGGDHYWSDADGTLALQGLSPGTYRVHVGAELYGATERAEDGTLTLRPGTEENPLKSLLAAGQEALVLQPDDYVDVERETVFTYYLRPEAKWSDGVPFTTADLEFGYHVLRNPLVDGDSIRTYYADLIECTPLTPHAVRMKYREQYFRAFEFTYALPAYTPPRHLFEEFFRQQGKELTLERLTAEEEAAQNKISVHGEAFARFFNSDPRYNDNPLGTGPYVIARWNRKDSLTLRRRDDYWDARHRGYLDEIVFKFVPEDTTAFQLLSGGQLDFYYRMNPEQYHEAFSKLPASRREQFVRASWFSPGFSYIGWNMLKEEFRDARVRLALALLFDVQGWIDQKLHGDAAAISGSQYIFGFGYDHSVLPVGYDPDVAAQLLERAGWVDSDGDGLLDRNGKPFRCTVLLPTGSELVRDQMAVLQRNCKQVGIQVDIQQLEWASFVDRLHNKDFDICRLGWAQSLEDDPFQIWHSSEAGVGKRSSNHVSFQNPLADRLIETLRVTLDEEKRRCLHYSFHRLLDREQPYRFLYTAKDYGVYHRKFRGVKWYPLRPGFDLREWWIAKEDQ